MRLRIHRGATEIGGNCVELEQDGKSILLDLGLPLDRAPTLPALAGLVERDDDLLGILLSHPHLDHYGLLPLAKPDLPVWLGAGAARMLAAAAPFAPGAHIQQPITTYRDREPFAVGPFRITPYLMDHSAFDAYGLLVEAGGKRLFYSGDFRGHGRKGYAFDRLLQQPPGQIDALLMEGTTLGRMPDAITEIDVEHDAAGIMRTTKGIVLTCFSGQNIDRFVSFFRASVSMRRTFVVDAYLANIIRGIGLSSLPDIEHDERIRVFLPASQRRAVIAQKRFDLVEWFKHRRIYPDELASRRVGRTMAFRGSMIRDVERVPLDDASLIYSMWPGYLDRNKIDLRDWCRQRRARFTIVHSSGHAHVRDLQRMAVAIDAGRVIPIHTVHPEGYASLFDGVAPVEDGKWTLI